MDAADHAATQELEHRLRQLGFLIVPHGKHLGVRGALYTSVRVSIENDQLHLEPRFGAFARITATVVKTFGATALAGIALVSGASTQVSATFTLLALALWGYDGVRYTLTESSMAQIRHAFGAMTPWRRTAIQETPVAALNAPPPVLGPDAIKTPRADVRR